MKTLPRDFLLALTSAVLLVLSFPKHNLYFLAWVGLVPLLIGLKGKSLKHAFALSFVMGISFLMGISYWINVLEKFELTDFFLLGLFLGSYFGLFGLALNLGSRNARFPLFLIAPSIWVSIEYLRSQGGFLALPWPFLGYSQFLNLPIIQVSSLTGVYGVSFLIVMVNVVLGELIMHFADATQRAAVQNKTEVCVATVVTGGLIGVTLLYGLYSLANEPQNGRVQLAVIQGNIPQDIRWKPQFREKNLEKHMQLSRQAANNHPILLVIWPETAVHGSVAQNKDLLDSFIVLSKATGVHVLIGVAERPKFSSGERGTRNSSNSAFLISPKGEIAGRYDKIRLVPFGEYLPFKNLPWPARIASSWNSGEFKPGSDYTLLNLDSVKLAVTICWENMFPDLFRQFVKNGANLAVNITNEAWFGKTAAPYQFLAMSVLRAVEHRISIARAANTGVSGFIDPFGRIIGTVNSGNRDIFVEGYLAKDVPISQSKTFYTKHGDLFAFGCVVFSLAMLFFSFTRSTRTDA